MDVAYNQHSPHSRHYNRSQTNLKHLSLAPLTSRLPLSDPDALSDASHVSYIEGRSAPTTPSILSRSSSRMSMRKSMDLTLPKSKSSTHLLAPRSRPTTPGGTKLRGGVKRDQLQLSTISAEDKKDSDWLLRAGSALSLSARESKGQTWLVSKASSTSLSGQQNDAGEGLERSEQNSRRTSRRASIDADDKFSPVYTRRSLSFGPTTSTGSRPISRFGSRANSRRGSRVHLTPLAGDERGYFDHKDFTDDEIIAEPDFVDVDDELIEEEDTSKADEATVRKLARANSQGLGGWVEKMLGWTLFAVEEDGEDVEAETTDDIGEESDLSSGTSRYTLHGALDSMVDGVPPPSKDEGVNGWQDAAWLLSVATKVIL